MFSVDFMYEMGVRIMFTKGRLEVILRVLFIDRLLRGKYTSFLLIANLYCNFFCFSKLDNYIFVQEFFDRYLLISTNDHFLI